MLFFESSSFFAMGNVFISGDLQALHNAVANKNSYDFDDS